MMMTVKTMIAFYNDDDDDDDNNDCSESGTLGPGLRSFLSLWLKRLYAPGSRPGSGHIGKGGVDVPPGGVRKGLHTHRLVFIFIFTTFFFFTVINAMAT